MKHIHLFFLGALLICSSCSTENPFEPEEVKLLVSIEGVEKSRVNLDGNGFDDGDQFAFFFEKREPVTSSMSLYGYNTSTGWGYINDPIYWDDQEERDDLYRYFCAVAPIEHYTVSNHSFSVKNDQTLDTDYKDSDLLIARVYTNKRLIPIKFYHAFSRVIVKITGSTDINNTNGYFDAADFNGMAVSLNNVKLTGYIDYSTDPIQNNETYNPEVRVNVADVDAAKSITMHSINSNPTANGTTKTVTSTFYAIVPPQIISTPSLLTIKIAINADGTDKTYYFKTTDVKFVKGNATSINLTLNKSDVELSAAEIDISSWKNILAEDYNHIVLE